jgi:phosphatidylserine decarboxylase
MAFCLTIPFKPASFDMDPFVVVTYGEQSYRTTTMKHNLNPVWNQKIILSVAPHASTWPITVSVYDRDRFSANDFVGSVQILTSSLIQQAATFTDTFVLPLNLSTEYDCEKHQASIALKATYEPLELVRKKFWTQLIKDIDPTPEDGMVTSEVLESVLVCLLAYYLRHSICIFLEIVSYIWNSTHPNI